jgi:hypothetical protein
MIRAGDMMAVQQHIIRLGKDIKSLIKAALEISWYSRGAWQYERVLLMSQAERELAVEFINDRLEGIKKSKTMFPVY